MVKAEDAPRILFLEDEPVVALDAVLSLQEHGFTKVMHVSTLSDAEECIERETIDLAILDINIDGVSSLDLARRLRERGIPLILASGYRPDDAAIMGIADAFVPKPYTARKLVHCVRSIGRQRAADRYEHLDR